MQTVANWITELEGQSGDERTQRTIQLNLMALKVIASYFFSITQLSTSLPQFRYGGAVIEPQFLGFFKDSRLSRDRCQIPNSVENL